MKIGIIGKFKNLYDEEYVARSFESLGHEIQRMDDQRPVRFLLQDIKEFQPEIILFFKLQVLGDSIGFLMELRKLHIKTVCWTFDLYFDYVRESRVYLSPCFRAQYVFSTDNGHADRWERLRIKHNCVRQGIYKEHAILGKKRPMFEHLVAFVGSENPHNPFRQEMIEFIKMTYGNKFKWYGREDTNEVRDLQLNNLYASTPIIIGDSVPSPHYWSNRVVETLGRGGFLIHPETDGIKAEYPNLTTYRKGSLMDLKNKIDYYLTHEAEREEIRQKNFEFVRSNYTMDKKCAEVLTLVCNSNQ